MWVQYLPQQFCAHFMYNSYSVCFLIIKYGGFLTVDYDREETLQSEHSLSYHTIK